MFQTKALSSLKSIFPPIHQPLPLSKRESQQLLKSLITSFRKQLDKEHGSTSDEISSDLMSGRTVPLFQSQTTSKKASTGEIRHQPTDLHLRTILANPLFSYKRGDRGGDRIRGDQAAWEVARTRRDPLDVFDEAVAMGMMNTKRATGVLIAVRREIAQSSSLSVVEEMRASGVGRKVLDWLRASGTYQDLSFLQHYTFVKQLVLAMTAEGLDEVAWNWFARLIARREHATDEDQKAATMLLGAIVAANGFGQESLDNAYASILRGAEMLKDRPAFEKTMAYVWKALNWQSTVEASAWSRPSENLFEAFGDIPKHKGASWTIDFAHLDLHHPTRPESSRATDLLLTDRWWTVHAERFLQKKHFQAITRLMTFGLDTVQHLNERGRSDEADRILDRVQAHVGPYIGGISHPHDLAHASPG